MAAKRASWEAVTLSIVRVSSWVVGRRNDITHKCLAISTGKRNGGHHFWPPPVLPSLRKLSTFVGFVTGQGNISKAALSFRFQEEGPLSALSSPVSTTSQEPFCSLLTPSSDAGGSWATTGCLVLALHPDSTTCPATTAPASPSCGGCMKGDTGQPRLQREVLHEANSS